MWSSEWQLWVVSGPQRLYQLNGRFWVQSGHPAGIFSNRKLNVRFRQIAVVQLIRKIWNRTAAFGQTRSFKRSEKRCGEGQKTARSRRNKLSLRLARPDRRCAVRRFRWPQLPHSICIISYQFSAHFSLKPTVSGLSWPIRTSISLDRYQLHST